ncbi:hypothetical protein ENSA5_55490 [Enhygromyxa salina]|uniref:Uncharacterized protein n=1 Tax=Enhygromyxa salina TaxID=215803 RepID=A0A2S9XEZ5_9BACT|nr:hypothetical protein [Enhygromyxa salina]PRP91432.1 hypothetical protein ENSA5_55490 [Enhygromyxa salina]
MRRAGLILLALAVSQLACRIPNEDHCGRRDGDATCVERDSARPYCSLCEPEHDGCVEAVAEITADCRPAGSGSDPGDGATETHAESGGETVATETGLTPECGNGVKEPGEDCDGMDFGELSCADPFGLPSGTLVCVVGQCVVDTSQCCLMDGQVCEPGECCNTNCNLVTNKCGL